MAASKLQVGFWAILFFSTLINCNYAFMSGHIDSSLSRMINKAFIYSRDARQINSQERGPTMSAAVSGNPVVVQSDIRPSEHDLLLRVARGEKGERTPVWLMRQAGRYMKAFREYSDKYPFRVRSETPEIAIELSLQPFRAFGTDGVIMFSDILTPLPSMGIEFDVVKGSGPVIFEPIRTAEQVANLKKIDDPDKTAPFLRTILSSLRKVQYVSRFCNRLFVSRYLARQQETEGKTTLLGFVGSPFTLAAYAIEGKANKNCFQVAAAPSPPPVAAAAAARARASRHPSALSAVSAPPRPRR